MSDMEKGHKGAQATEFLQRRLASHQDFVRTATVTRAAEALAEEQLFRWDWSGLNNGLFRSETGGALANEIGLRYLPTGLFDDFRPRLGRQEDTLYPPVWRNWLSRELLRLFTEEEEALIRSVLSMASPEQAATAGIQAPRSQAQPKRLQTLIEAAEQGSPGLTSVLREEARRKALRGLSKEEARTARVQLAALPAQPVLSSFSVEPRDQRRSPAPSRSPYPSRLGAGGVFRTLLSAVPVSVDERADYRTPEAQKTEPAPLGMAGGKAPFIWIEGIGVEKTALPALTAGLKGWTHVVHRTAVEKGKRRRAAQLASSFSKPLKTSSRTLFAAGLISDRPRAELVQITGETPTDYSPGSFAEKGQLISSVSDVVGSGVLESGESMASWAEQAQDGKVLAPSLTPIKALIQDRAELQLSELVSGPQYDMSTEDPVRAFTQRHQVVGKSPSEGFKESSHRAWRQFSPAKALSLSLLSGAGFSSPAMVNLGLSQQREAYSGRESDLGSASLEGRAALSDWIQESGEWRWEQRTLTPFGAVTIDRSLDSVKAMRHPTVPSATLVQIVSEHRPEEKSIKTRPQEERLGRPAIRAIKSGQAAPLALISSTKPTAQVRLALKEPTAMLTGAATFMNPVGFSRPQQPLVSPSDQQEEVGGQIFAGLRAHLGAFSGERPGAELDLRSYFQTMSSTIFQQEEKEGRPLQGGMLTRPELVLMVSEYEGGVVAQSLGQVPFQVAPSLGSEDLMFADKSIPLSVAVQPQKLPSQAPPQRRLLSSFPVTGATGPGHFVRQLRESTKKTPGDGLSKGISGLGTDLWFGQMVDRATRLTNQGLTEMKELGTPSRMTTVSLGQVMGLAEEVSLSSPAGAKSIERALLPLLVRIDSAVRAGDKEAGEEAVSGTIARSPQVLEIKDQLRPVSDILRKRSLVAMPGVSFRAFPDAGKRSAVIDYHGQFSGLSDSTGRLISQLFQPPPSTSTPPAMSTTDRAIMRSVRGLLHPLTGQPRILGSPVLSAKMRGTGETATTKGGEPVSLTRASGKRANIISLVKALEPTFFDATGVDMSWGAAQPPVSEQASFPLVDAPYRPQRRAPGTLNTLSGMISQIMGEGVGRAALLRKSPTALALGEEDQGRALVQSGLPVSGKQAEAIPPLFRSITMEDYGKLSPSGETSVADKQATGQLFASQPLSLVASTGTGPVGDTVKPSRSSISTGGAAVQASDMSIEPGQASDGGWLDKEMKRVLSSFSHINVALHEPVQLRTRSESAARALLDYLELAPQRPAAAKQSEKFGRQADLRPEIVETTPIRVRRSETRLGRAFLSSREMSASSASVQGEAKAVSREYVSPAPLGAVAPGMTTPLARVSQQTGGQEAERAELAEDGAAPPEENIVQMAEEVYGIIKGRMEEEASRFGR